MLYQLVYLKILGPYAKLTDGLTHKQYVEQHNQQLWLESFLGFEPRVVKLKLTMNCPRKCFHLIGKSAGCAPSLRVIPWRLPYE